MEALAAPDRCVRAMTMKIKQATIDDSCVLAELCSEIHGIHIKLQPLIFREPSHQELIDLFRKRISDPDYIAFIAFDVGKPVGYTVFHILRKPENIFAYERNILEIDHIHINERYWRKGICKKLFAKALEVARSFDIENIQLGVWSLNDRAIAAFNSLGFKQQFYIMALEDRSKLEQINTAEPQGGAGMRNPMLCCPGPAD